MKDVLVILSDQEKKVYNEKAESAWRAADDLGGVLDK